MVKDVLGNGTGGFSKNVTEDIIKLEVGNRQAVLGSVFLPGEHVSKLKTVTHEVTEMSNFRGWNKAGFNHIAHEEVTDPFGVFAVGLVALLRFRVFGMSKGNEAGFFKDIEDGDPVLSGRLHTDFGTGVFSKPVSQFIETIGKGRETSLPVLCAAIGIRSADAGINPGFVDIETTAIFTKDFKSQ